MNYATNEADVSPIDTRFINTDGTAMIDSLLYFPENFSKERVLTVLNETFYFFRANVLTE